MNKIILPFLLVAITTIFAQPSTEISDLNSWSDVTHSKKSDPNYGVVFNQDEVLVIDIVIDSENWAVMQSDLVTKFGSVQDGQMDRDPADRDPADRDPADRDPADRDPADRDPADRPPMNIDGGETGSRGAKNMNSSFPDFNPVTVDASLIFEGSIWEHIGIRYKGNSSLMSAYRGGNSKLSFKLTFDEFEDDYPALKNQRFYGFKQLNLNNNFSDQSMLREKLGSDLFREFGLVSAQTSFCALYVDYGEGRQYMGLYTMVEEMDDTVLDTQIGNDSGNLYKPDGLAASFAAGSFDEKTMEKKNNEKKNDYSDVYALYEAINSDLRLSNTNLWKSGLEDIFNVDGFLKWLAANSTIQNWDTYGNSTRNYYLYHEKKSDKLVWIPWDNNESLLSGKGRQYDLVFNGIDETWPLIKYLLDDEEYLDIYKSYLKAFRAEVFTEDHMDDMIDKYSALVESFAYEEELGFTFLRSAEEFDLAIEDMKEHVINRMGIVDSFIK